MAESSPPSVSECVRFRVWLWLVSRLGDEPFGDELCGVMIYFRVMQDFPVKAHYVSEMYMRARDDTADLPAIGDKDGTFGQEVAFIHIVFHQTTR